MICNRCGDKVNAFTTSMFNLEEICIDCKNDEREAPGYRAAVAIEYEQVKQGNYNFRGVGLSAADAAFLAERRSQRQ